jgi:ribosomal protein S18 acetylase RimI-like enzyme
MQTKFASNLSFLEFHPGNHSDKYLEWLVKIHNEILLTKASKEGKFELPATGFLLIEIEKEYILKQLDSGSKYYICVDEKDDVLGYMVVDNAIDSDTLNRVIWSEPFMKEKVIGSNHRYINLAAVSSMYSGQGVGQFMYQSIYTLYPECWISAFYVSSPVENIRSKVFHEKQGFECIGRYESNCFLGISNYQSTLVLREPEQESILNGAVLQKVSTCATEFVPS